MTTTRTEYKNVVPPPPPKLESLYDTRVKCLLKNNDVLIQNLSTTSSESHKFQDYMQGSYSHIQLHQGPRGTCQPNNGPPQTEQQFPQSACFHSQVCLSPLDCQRKTYVDSLRPSDQYSQCQIHGFCDSNEIGTNIHNGVSFNTPTNHSLGVYQESSISQNIKPQNYKLINSLSPNCHNFPSHQIKYQSITNPPFMDISMPSNHFQLPSSPQYHPQQPSSPQYHPQQPNSPHHQAQQSNTLISKPVQCSKAKSVSPQSPNIIHNNHPFSNLSPNSEHINSPNTRAIELPQHPVVNNFKDLQTPISPQLTQFYKPIYVEGVQEQSINPGKLPLHSRNVYYNAQVPNVTRNEMVNYSKPQNTMIPRTCTIDDDFVYSPQATNKVMIRYVEEPNFCTNPGSHNCSPREITDLQASSTRNAHAMGVVSHQLPNSHLNFNLNSPPCGITQYSDKHSANSVFDSRNENPERMGYSSKNDSERQFNIDTYCHGRARQHPQIRPSGINYSPIPHIDAAIQASQKHVCGQNQIPNTQSEWETGVQQRSDCSVGYTIKSNHGAIPSINNDHCTNNVYCSNAQIDCSQTDGIGCKKVRIEERSSMNGILDYTRHTESDTTSWHHRDHQPGVSFSPKDNELRLPIFSSLVNALSESDGIWPYTANDRETREALGITLAPDVIAHMVKYYAIRNQPLEEDIYSISSKYSVSADKIKSWFEIQNKYDNEARDSSNRARCI